MNFYFIFCSLVYLDTILISDMGHSRFINFRIEKTLIASYLLLTSNPYSFDIDIAVEVDLIDSYTQEILSHTISMNFV